MDAKVAKACPIGFLVFQNIYFHFANFAALNPPCGWAVNNSLDAYALLKVCHGVSVTFF